MLPHKSPSPKLGIRLVLTLLGFGVCLGQQPQLSAEYLDVKLPFPAYCQAPFYDGNDLIYLFGSCAEEPHNPLLAFSLTSETIQVLDNLPGRAYRATAHGDEEGNIFLIGGGGNNNQVFKYSPQLNSTSVVATLPTSVYGATSFKLNSTVYIVGGGDFNFDDLLTFDMTGLDSAILTTLPFRTHDATSVLVDGAAFIFNDARVDNAQALRLDLATLEMSRVGPATLPILDHIAASVWDGQFIYILGGYDTAYPTEGIYQFDPVTFENNFIPVSNLPVNSSFYFRYAPASVFVPSRNRIYCFGGYTRDGNTMVIHDEIFYIDLTPLQTTENPINNDNLNPELFSCLGRTNGLYLHPEDCSMFIGCRDEEMEIFRCPHPLLFDPVTGICESSSDITCG